ncbi:MAG: hypothetical protein RI907_3349, partial [Pseudomonadota bacterium]
MKLSMNKLVVAAALVAAGAAHAELSPVMTITEGQSITYAGWTVSNARGTGTLTFDKTLTSALNLAGIKMTAIAPATLNAPVSATTGKYTSISAASKVTSGSGIFDTTSQQLTVVGVSSVGGATLTSFGDDDATNSGGFLSIQNIGADITTKTIYADVTGGNGLTGKRLAMWNFTTLTGDTVFPAVVGTTTSTNSVTGLTITAEAFEYFATALGLNQFGRDSMANIKNYGTFQTVISMD